MRRTFDSGDFDARVLADLKRGRRVSVCLPARDEEATVGQTVAAIRRELMEEVPLVDELVVVDDGSRDQTARVATAGGATVISASTLLTDYQGPGKGQAMWKGVHATSGDLVVFCDADIREFDPGYVTGLAGPLLTRDDTAFVKGFYARPLDGRPGEGGRVTELMARPLISVFFPHLADLAQPLSGECAARRDVLETLPFMGGYGVDLGLLVDVTERYGNAALVQCDLGVRVHRNRTLAELGPQALAILQVALARSGETGSGAFPWTAHLIRPEMEPASVELIELPPLVSVPAHRKSA